MQEFYEIANGVLIRYTGREEELEVPEGSAQLAKARSRAVCP